MSNFFFNNRRSHKVVNSMEGQKLLSDKPFEGHKLLLNKNHLSHGIKVTHGFNGLMNVLRRASAIYRASANINSERKRAVCITP